jgi:hypothetical protein
MAKYITPTLAITSNKYTATTNPGPTSSPLAVSVTDTLDVTEVVSKIVTVSADHAILFDEDAFHSAPASAGTDGAFVYLKNLHATVNIYIGHGADGGLSGATATRLMTLLPGEFAWFGWDMEADLIVDANGAGADGLEAILFIRTATT